MRPQRSRRLLPNWEGEVPIFDRISVRLRQDKQARNHLRPCIAIEPCRET